MSISVAVIEDDSGFAATLQRFLKKSEDVKCVGSFRTADEMVRMRGEWRIARPLGEASMPDWQPIPRSVDI